MNKRIKELQSALEEAQTEEEKDEIERELERLREEQQKILRDAEERGLIEPGGTVVEGEGDVG